MKSGAVTIWIAVLDWIINACFISRSSDVFCDTVSIEVLPVWLQGHVPLFCFG